MATITDYQRLRADLDATDATFPDAEAEEIFVEASEMYTSAGSIYAATRVIAIRRLLASSAKRVSYTQNNSSQSASDVFKHLKELLGIWGGLLADAVLVDEAASRGSALRSGRQSRKPARLKEFPGLW